MHFSEARTQYMRWLAATKNPSPHTVRAYNGDLLALERHLGSSTDVTKLTATATVTFIDEQRARGVSPASRRRRASSVRGFYAWLADSGTSPALTPPLISVQPERGRSLPKHLGTRDVERLLKFLMTQAEIGSAPIPPGAMRRPHEATTLIVVALMVATGVRVAEAVAVRYEDLDHSRESLRILGKGKRERMVYITNCWLRELLEAYLESRFLIGFSESRLFFNRRLKPLTAPSVRSRLSRAAQEAGLGKRVTPHMLRHTAATQLVDAGVDIRCIQRLLGHASLSTTEIYTHVSDQTLKRVISEADVLGSVTR